MSKDQDWNITSFFDTNRPKIFFQTFSSRENDQTIQDSAGTLCSRPVGHNFSILDAGQASLELARKELSVKKALVCPLKITRRARVGPAVARMKGVLLNVTEVRVLWKLAAADRNVREEKNFWKKYNCDATTLKRKGAATKFRQKTHFPNNRHPPVFDTVHAVRIFGEVVFTECFLVRIFGEVVFAECFLVP